jgi:hypothetical protein
MISLPSGDFLPRTALLRPVLSRLDRSHAVGMALSFHSRITRMRIILFCGCGLVGQDDSAVMREQEGGEREIE